MSRKFYALLVPVLATAAVAFTPSIASAVTTYGTCSSGTTSANCPSGEKFAALPEFERWVAVSRLIGVFRIENAAKTADIECTTGENIGYVWNIGGRGFSIWIFILDNCKGSGALAGCTINPKTNHELEGEVKGEVATETTVKGTVLGGFNVKCLEGGVETELGNVTGSVTGTQTTRTNVLKFSNAAGLKFAGEALTLTGEEEAFTAQGKKVYI